jgi:surfeit locus 1 family protein
MILWTVPIVTFGLGTWQFQRLITKPSEILKEAKKVDKIPNCNEFEKFIVSGRFEGKDFKVGERVFSGKVPEGIRNIGHVIITPFVLENSKQIILVNRGWLPLDRSSDQDISPKQSTIEVITRKGESESMLSMKSEHPKYHRMITSEMEKHLGQKNMILVEMMKSPVNTQSMPLLRDWAEKKAVNHLEYALTWFGLCFVSSFMLLNKRRYQSKFNRFSGF